MNLTHMKYAVEMEKTLTLSKVWLVTEAVSAVQVVLLTVKRIRLKLTSTAEKHLKRLLLMQSVCLNKRFKTGRNVGFFLYIVQITV